MKMKGESPENDQQLVKNRFFEIAAGQLSVQILLTGPREGIERGLGYLVGVFEGVLESVLLP